MTYDLDFRYARALQPEGLSILATAFQAVADAIKDARNAGLDPERDPGVILLARHLGRLASPQDPADRHPEDSSLRRQCLDRIADLKAKPAIIALVRGGVDYDPEAKRAFRREASRALRQIACELGMFRRGREIAYRLARNRHDEFGGPIHHADIGCLADMPEFARRVARDLGLMSSCDQPRLFAGD